MKASLKLNGVFQRSLMKSSSYDHYQTFRSLADILIALSHCCVPSATGRL